MSKVIGYEVEDCGIEHVQYFQGLGTAFTDWDAVFVGVGENFAEALDDAIEQVCSAHDWTVTGEQVAQMQAEGSDDEVGDSDYPCDMDEIFYHVGIYVKLG